MKSENEFKYLIPFSIIFHMDSLFFAQKWSIQFSEFCHQFGQTKLDIGTIYGGNGGGGGGSLVNGKNKFDRKNNEEKYWNNCLGKVHFCLLKLKGHKSSVIN
jgi:hypothetical protein